MNNADEVIRSMMADMQAAYGACEHPALEVSDPFQMALEKGTPWDAVTIRCVQCGQTLTYPLPETAISRANPMYRIRLQEAIAKTFKEGWSTKLTGNMTAWGAVVAGEKEYEPK